MSSRNLFIIHLLLAIVCTCLGAQDSLSGKINPIAKPLRISMIGDDESLQSSLNIECSDILINIKDLDISQAYTVWLSMLSDLEKYADRMSFDIKGLRIWINVYWEEDGSIRHINFYPKPNCKNIDFEQFSYFLNGFANDYALAIKHSSCFSHFGSASFPTFYDQLLKKE